jgi:dTDP-4-amino-4,6-dideoxygalactose transaminase
VAAALAGGHAAGDGSFTAKCHAFLENALGSSRALLTTSGTHSLELAALVLDVGPRDEVIVPSFTFVSTANAFVLRGARPVFADIREDTLNLDERQLESLISERTRAIVPVHYAGVGCAMDCITGLAQRRQIAVVEDNAHGLFARYRGRYLGTFGCLAAQSFHETKNITCGEGGALLINDSSYIERAEIIRQKGTDRGRFYRGQVDKYTWVDIGSSYLLSDILAAFLYAQLERRELIYSLRRQIWNTYQEQLQEWAAQHGVRLPYVPAECQQAYHMFYLIMPTLHSRRAMIEHLKDRGILSVFHYSPLHLSEMGLQFGARAGQCPVTEWVADRLLRLPFYNDLHGAEQGEVIEAILSFDRWTP